MRQKNPAPNFLMQGSLIQCLDDCTWYQQGKCETVNVQVETFVTLICMARRKRRNGQKRFHCGVLEWVPISQQTYGTHLGLGDSLYLQLSHGRRLSGLVDMMYLFNAMYTSVLFVIWLIFGIVLGDTRTWCFDILLTGKACFTVPRLSPDRPWTACKRLRLWLLRRFGDRVKAIRFGRELQNATKM